MHMVPDLYYGALHECCCESGTRHNITGKSQRIDLVLTSTKLRLAT